MPSKKPSRLKRVVAFFARISPINPARARRKALLDSTMRTIRTWVHGFEAVEAIQKLKRKNPHLTNQAAADLLLKQLNEAHLKRPRPHK